MEKAVLGASVDELLSESLKCGASDIYIEANPQGVEVKFRAQGAIETYCQLNSHAAANVINTLKARAGLVSQAHWSSADARFEFEHQEIHGTFRVCLYRTAFGESLALRVLDGQRPCLSMDELGIPSQILGEVMDRMHRRRGLFLVCGPMGSGKTTTLHAILEHMDLSQEKVITVEDPVEYSHPQMTQVSIDEQAGYTFAKAMKAILRHDPDVIMLGEIRDEDSAKMALQASLTGHLVLATIHAGDPVGALLRLKDVKVSGLALASTLQGVLGQKITADSQSLSLQKDSQKHFLKRSFSFMENDKKLQDLLSKDPSHEELKAWGQVRFST